MYYSVTTERRKRRNDDVVSISIIDILEFISIRRISPSRHLFGKVGFVLKIAELRSSFRRVFLDKFNKGCPDTTRCI